MLKLKPTIPLLLVVAFAAAHTPLRAQNVQYRLKVPVGGLRVQQVRAALAPAALPPVLVGHAYSFDLQPFLTVTGDAAFSGSGVSWAVVSNTLPAGLYLTSDGYIGGTPTAAGSGSITVQVAYKGVVAQQTYQVAVSQLEVELAPAVLPQAKVGQLFAFDFGQVLSIVGDVEAQSATATWTVSPALPVGLSLSSTGVLSGTPVSADSLGTSYEVSATYKGVTAKRAYQLSISEATLTSAQYRLLMSAEGKANGAKLPGDMVNSISGGLQPATVYSASIDTATSKFGSGSIKLNNFWGGGSWGAAYVGFPIVTGGERPFAFGSGDFLVDTFVKSSGFGCYGAIYLSHGAHDSAVNTFERSWSVETNGSGQISFKVFTDMAAGKEVAVYSLTTSAAVPAGAWAHVGVSRKAGTVRIFINGVEAAKGAYADSTERTRHGGDLSLILGKPTTNGNGCHNGTHNFDELRVVKGFGVDSLPVPVAPYAP